MIRTEPDGEDIDPLDLQMGYRRARRDRPWVMANFVSTIDGAAVVDGGTTAINDPDDRAMFAAIRAVADFIVVGAETLRTEDYGPVRLDDRYRRMRREKGLDDVPHLVVVSRLLDLDPGARVFADPDRRVMILTGEGAPDDRFSALLDVADVVKLKETDPGDIVHYLRMAGVILCEGGPDLWGQFVRADLVDEMALTISPLLAAGEAIRVARGPLADPPLDMRLDDVAYGDRSLFLRYLRV